MHKNLGLKALSLVLALLIWLQMSLNSEHTTTARIPVQLNNLPSNITLSEIPRDVAFAIKGKGQDLLRLYFSNTKISIDASTIKEKSSKLPLDNYSIIDLPANISVEFLGPADDTDINLNTDVLVHKDVKIVPIFENSAARAQYQNQKYLLTPEKIRINGPRKVISELNSINTIPITLSMLEQDRFDIAIAFKNQQVSSNIAKASVSRIPVRIETRIFEAQPIQSSHRSLMPNTATLKVEGTAEQIKMLKASAIIIRADDEPDAEGWVTLKVLLPEGFDTYQVTPQKVLVR